MKRCALLLALILTLNTMAFCLADAQIGYINEDTKVYMDASEKAIVDGNASLGNQVRIEEEKAAEGIGWYRVTFLANNKEGWVKADDVDLVIAKKAITASEQPAAVTPGDAKPIERESDFPVLKASGAVDPDTLPGAPDASQYHELFVGDSGAEVNAVVQRLYELGYLEEGKTKKLTKAHMTAIKQFQKANGLQQDSLCTAQLQAKLFSQNAKNKKGQTLSGQDALQFTKGTVKADNKGGGTITFSVKNNTGMKVDAFNITLRLYNTYGERFLFNSVFSDMTLTDELTALDHAEERATFKKNETIQFGFSLGNYYFAGVLISVTAYHVEGGDTVRIPEDQRHWYGFGKGVEAGYQPLVVTPLTDAEKKLASRWESGIEGVYVDDEIAAAYGVREGYLIQKMDPGSMMDAAGLKMGDVLLAIGDVRIYGTTSIERAMAGLSAGQAVTVLFLRNGVVYQTQMVAPGGAAAA